VPAGRKSSQTQSPTFRGRHSEVVRELRSRTQCSVPTLQQRFCHSHPWAPRQSAEGLRCSRTLLEGALPTHEPPGKQLIQARASKCGGNAMKKLMFFVVAVGAWTGIGTMASTPEAQAFGWCGCRSACAPVYYRPAACGCRHYRVVRYYRARRCCR
jgi:hypothetical protein